MAVISKRHYHGILLILVVSDNSRGIAQVLLPQGRCQEKPISRLTEQWSLILETIARWAILFFSYRSNSFSDILIFLSEQGLQACLIYQEKSL
jgi:hypothetical protein